MSILGPDGATAGVSFPTGGLQKKKPIADIRMVMFPKMMVHPETKQMVMVPMQDLQYQREGSNEWFSVAIHETEKHDFNPEEKNEEVSSTSPSGVILS
jgi:hypothetical protein